MESKGRKVVRKEWRKDRRARNKRGRKEVKEERSGEKTIKDRRIELINEEIEKQRGGKSRIEVTKAKGNKHLQDAVEDDRFGSLFDNKEFEIDQDGDDWKIRNPMKNAKKVKKLLNENDSLSNSDSEIDEKQALKFTHRQKSDKKGALNLAKRMMDAETTLKPTFDKPSASKVWQDSDDEVEVEVKKPKLIADSIKKDAENTAATVISAAGGNKEIIFKPKKQDLKEDADVVLVKRPKKKVDKSRRKANYLLPKEKKKR